MFVARSDLPARRSALSKSSAAVLTLVHGAMDRDLVGKLRYTLSEVAQKAGVPAERARRLWTAMGFTSGDAREVMYSKADAQAMRLIASLADSGFINRELEAPLTRALFQTFARMAEWQVSLIDAYLVEGFSAVSANGEPVSEDAALATVRQLLPAIEELQALAWRRHLAAATRRALAEHSTEGTTRTLVVGFADMVGYTSLSRRISIGELGALLEKFESVLTDAVTARGGWVVKNLGDEVMFACEDPADAARIGLEMQSAARLSKVLPAVRVGMAMGPALVRFGDLYGPVVNIAARLTSVAEPGTVLVDEELAAAVREDLELDVKGKRANRVRGYRRLKGFHLRWRGQGRTLAGLTLPEFGKLTGQ